MLSVASSKPQPNTKNGWDPQTEDVSSADEKKTGFKDLIKKLPRLNTTGDLVKDPKCSLDKDNKPKLSHLRDQTEVSNCYFC